MVEINRSDIERRNIMSQYYDVLEKWIQNRDCKSMMFKYYKKHLRQIVCCPPDKLLEANENFETHFKKQMATYNTASYKKKPNTVFARFCQEMTKFYKTFMGESSWVANRKNGYVLMEKMGIGVCPYCNRSYSSVIDEDEVSVRAEFDHFYPKSKYPILALSFFNLVPSCPTCNHLKKEQILSHNPWARYKKDKPVFKVDTSKVLFPSNPEIIIENENLNTQKLGIKQLYNTHNGYVLDILNKIQAYNPATYSAIVNDFQGVLSEADLQRIIWGNYTDEVDEMKRPLSKLTVDILEQFKKYIP